MKLPKMSFTAAGDMLAQRMMATDYDGFREVSEHIKKGEARFCNLETTLHYGEHCGNQFNGGSFHRSDPKTLDIVKEFGFNMLSFANNHTFDYGYGGLESTLRYVTEAGFVHSGVGRNLDEAAAPAYLDTKNGRIALISMASSFCNEAAMAGRQSRRVKGRPGLNALRINEKIEVTPEQLEVLRQIADESGINAGVAISRSEGYTAENKDKSSVELGKKVKFVCGERPHYCTSPNEKDMQRLQQAVYEAQAQADYILVSIHSHQVGGTAKEVPAEFLVEFAHRCIDMGVHAVLGHGPHLLRPLEIYKNRPIFYSLGNFVIHNESLTFSPEDFYEKYGFTSDDPLCDVYKKRSKNYTRGLLCDHRMLESVVPYFEMEDGELTHLELLPIELGFEKPRYRNGDPTVRTDKGIIERYAEMSAPYGTKIRIDENGIGIVEL